MWQVRGARVVGAGADLAAAASTVLVEASRVHADKAKAKEAAKATRGAGVEAEGRGEAGGGVEVEGVAEAGSASAARETSTRTAQAGGQSADEAAAEGGAAAAEAGEDVELSRAAKAASGEAASEVAEDAAAGAAGEAASATAAGAAATAALHERFESVLKAAVDNGRVDREQVPPPPPSSSPWTRPKDLPFLPSQRPVLRHRPHRCTTSPPAPLPYRSVVLG